MSKKGPVQKSKQVCRALTKVKSEGRFKSLSRTMAVRVAREEKVDFVERLNQLCD